MELPALGRHREGTLCSNVKGSGEVLNDFEVDGTRLSWGFLLQQKAVPLLGKGTSAEKTNLVTFLVFSPESGKRVLQ